MNDFEGTNTGKWLVREATNGLYEAECPVCGYCLPVAVNFDIMSLKMQVHGLEDFCPSCNEAMFQKEPELFIEETPFCKTTFAKGLDPNPYPRQLIIKCDKILLEHNSLGLQVDISDSIENFDTVEINGTKFVREV